LSLHLTLMIKVQYISALVLLVFIVCSSTQSARALEPSEHRTYLLFPPELGSEAGSMVFPESNNETFLADKPGIMVRQQLFQKEEAVFHIKKQTKFHLSGQLGFELEWGSIHVESAGDGKLKLSKVEVNYTKGANFIAFVSGDQKQIIIKSFGSDLSVFHPDTNQRTIVQNKMATNIESSTGMLLAPYPLPSNSPAKWWETEQYAYPYTQLPIANAGLDIRVPTGAPVTLSADGSNVQKGDILEWSILEGPTKTLHFQDEDIQHPQFVAEVEGIYTIGFQIENDKGSSNIDTVQIFVGLQYLQPINFYDVAKEHPHNLALMYLSKRGVLTGSKSPLTGRITLNPDEEINRAAFLKMLYVNLRKPVPLASDISTNPFLDVDSGEWFYPYAVQGFKEEILKSHTFEAAKPVNYAEALAMYTRALGLEVSTPKEGQEWFHPLMEFGRKWGVLPGKVQGDMLSRAQVAQMMLTIDTSDIKRKLLQLSGQVLTLENKSVVPYAQILVYSTQQNSSQSGGVPFAWEKGELLHRLTANFRGQFSVALPDKKYFVEAITPQNIASSALITAPQQGLILEVKD
jgi:hypothetical protein